MRILLTLFLSLCLVIPANAQGKRSDTQRLPRLGALEELLAHIPASTSAEIYFTDMAASRRQIDPLTLDAPTEVDRLLTPWTALMPPPGLDRDRIMIHLDAPEEALGISLFGFDQMVGWRDDSDVPVIATGIDGHHDSMIAAFTRDGMESRDLAGHTVWHIGGDSEIDIRNRTSNPFGGALGAARRMSLEGDTLIVTRTWPMMETLLIPGATLAQDPNAAGILRAAYSLPDAGDVINVVMVSGQPAKAMDPAALLLFSKNKTPEQVQADLAAMPEYALPGLPRFARYGLVLWQDVYETTGAIVIPFIRRDTAELARDRFTALLESGTSTYTRGPFAELFPTERRFEIIETQDRNVLVLGFVMQSDPDEPVKLFTFMNNWQHRLVQLLFTGDLPLLIGYSN